MKYFTKLSLFLLVLTLTACGPKSAPATLQFDNPYAPQAGDGDLMASDITVDSNAVFLLPETPAQLEVDINYFPATPCNDLRIEVSGPDAQNHIDLKAYGVAEKDKPCALMPIATPQQVKLNLGTLPKGHYVISLNGNQIGEVDV